MGKVPLGAGSVLHYLDPAALPAGAVVTLTTEVSEDGGWTWWRFWRRSWWRPWRVHGGAIVEKDKLLPRDVKPGTGIRFEHPRGNRNPNYMVRTTARLATGEEVPLSEEIKFRV